MKSFTEIQGALRELKEFCEERLCEECPFYKGSRC